MKKVSQIPMPWELAGADPKTPVLLALSGGADSRFLLDRLAKGSRRYGFSLLLAHVNHGIRGANADRDAEFCRALAEQYDLPIEVLSVNVPSLAKAHGRGIEEEAREVRYAFFEKLMREKSIPLLATAHQADDLLETMLFRIARGTGTAGLCSILPARPFANGSVTRPLLGLSAAEIRKACRAEGLDFTEDETNADPTYARNLIRAQVIPALEKLYAAPQKQAAKLAERVRLDEDYFAGQVAAFWQANTQKELSCGALAKLHPAIPKSGIFRPLRPSISPQARSSIAESAVTPFFARKSVKTRVRIAGWSFASAPQESSFWVFACQNAATCPAK